MEILKEHQSIIQGFTNTKLLYKKYNKTALVLTEYELTYHKAWIKYINEGQKHLQVMHTLYCILYVYCIVL